MAPLNFTALLIVLGLGLDPAGAVAGVFDDGGFYESFTDFEACNEFLIGDKDIEEERWDIDFSNCLERWPELG